MGRRPREWGNYSLRPCQACGVTVAMRFMVNRRHGGGKARVPHRCPHGVPCAAGDRLLGTHANANTMCRECTRGGR